MRLFNFYSSGCISCQTISSRLSTKFTVIDVDINENPVTAAKYSVLTVPTLILVDSMGNEVVRCRAVDELLKVV